MANVAFFARATHIIRHVREQKSSPLPRICPIVIATLSGGTRIGQNARLAKPPKTIRFWHWLGVAAIYGDLNMRMNT
jgi:hypothetical protein